MQVQETEGVLALKKLQNNELRVWAIEEIEKSRLHYKSRDILSYVSKMNSKEETPSSPSLKSLFKLDSGYPQLLELLDKGMMFNFTMMELIRCYGGESLFRNYHIRLPENLNWANKYMGDVGLHHRGSALSIIKKMKPENARSPVYPRRWISNLLDENGLPYNFPLNLSIPIV